MDLLEKLVPFTHCPPLLQLGPGELQHGLLPVHLRAASHMVPLLPAAVAKPAPALAAGRPAAASAAHL
jgi:hypothetical protein